MANEQKDAKEMEEVSRQIRMAWKRGRDYGQFTMSVWALLMFLVALVAIIKR